MGDEDMEAVLLEGSIGTLYQHPADPSTALQAPGSRCGGSPPDPFTGFPRGDYLRRSWQDGGWLRAERR
ncbi:unnamed protein product [Boreogadus saida]